MIKLFEMLSPIAALATGLIIGEIIKNIFYFLELKGRRNTSILAALCMLTTMIGLMFCFMYNEINL